MTMTMLLIDERRGVAIENSCAPRRVSERASCEI
jgi:hypothetical protein